MIEKLALIEDLRLALARARDTQRGLEDDGRIGYATLRNAIETIADDLVREAAREDRATTQAEMEYLVRQEDAAMERAS